MFKYFYHNSVTNDDYNESQQKLKAKMLKERKCEI